MLPVADFREKILDNSRRGDWLYRGQSDPDWGLTSTLSRFCARHQIRFSLDDFGRMLDGFIRRSSEFLEVDWHAFPLATRIALAQHHGLPTPFLDWTASPYVALFFALVDHATSLDTPQRCAVRVWALNAETDRPLENLAELHPGFGIVTPPGFMSRRMTRQQGCFTYLGSDVDLADQAKALNLHLKPYDVAADVTTVLRELRLMGLSAGTLFATVDAIAQDVILDRVLRELRPG